MEVSTLTLTLTLTQGVLRYTVYSIHKINYKFKIYKTCIVFCRLLNYASAAEVKLPNAEKQLNNEIQWTKKTKVLGKNTRDSFVIPSIFNPLILSHFDILKYICNPKHCI